MDQLYSVLDEEVVLLQMEFPLLLDQIQVLEEQVHLTLSRDQQLLTLEEVVEVQLHKVLSLELEAQVVEALVLLKQSQQSQEQQTLDDEVVDEAQHNQVEQADDLVSLSPLTQQMVLIEFLLLLQVELLQQVVDKQYTHLLQVEHSLW